MRESKPDSEPINEMVQIITRARVNANKKPIYDTLRSHQASWRDQTKSKGDIVKLQTIAGFVVLREMLETEYEKAKCSVHHSHKEVRRMWSKKNIKQD